MIRLLTGDMINPQGDYPEWATTINKLLLKRFSIVNCFHTGLKTSKLPVVKMSTGSKNLETLADSQQVMGTYTAES